MTFITRWALGRMVRRHGLFAVKRELARPARYYGDGGTIHGTQYVDVCVNEQGHVTQVWFRCQPLPFRATYGSNRGYAQPSARLTGVELVDGEPAAEAAADRRTGRHL